MKRASRAPAKKQPNAAKEEVQATLEQLRNKSTKRTLEGMARYGIPSDHALGVAMNDIKSIAKSLGRDHALAAGLWKTGCYEARLLAAFVEDPERVTSTQMDRWCRDFDNWAVCDTLCFQLFDKTPHAWSRIDAWGKAREEFVKRAAFALLASMALHDKQAEDGLFLRRLPLVQRAATDDRNFVKKGVSWALRAIGRRNAALHAAAIATARRLAASSNVTERWVGKDALRDLAKARKS